MEITGHFFNQQERISSGQKYIFHQKSVNLIIECDGHDFHEKTKKQAARDKRRDRTLQSSGYKVFRFTGTEITRDSLSCAEEVFNALLHHID